MRRGAAVAASLGALLLAAILAAAPARALSVKAPSAIVVDAGTGETLWARDPDARLPIASTTKLMTAMLALDSGRLDRRIVSPGYSPGPQEVTIGLVRGERMTVHDLLLALLLPSANDAAFTLADGIGGSIPAFVRSMNARAAGLGLAGTAYSNPIGLDEPGNHSTARDLATLASRLLDNPVFADVVDRPVATLRSGIRPRTVVNRNDLVARYGFVDGVKTGHTARAGYVLVAAARARGAQVVSAVLHEPDERTQDADSLALLRFALARFTRVHALAAGATVARAKVKYFAGRRVRLVATRGVGTVGLRGRKVTLAVRAPARLAGPIPRGRRVGAVTVSYDGRPLRTVALVTADAVPAAGLLRRLGPVGDAGLAALACLGIGSVAAAWRLARSRRSGVRREAAG